MIAFGTFLFIFGLILVLSSGQGTTNDVGGFDRVAANGTPARAIVLSVGSTASRVSLGMRRFERRSVVLDVEVPGQQPYVMSGAVLIPRGVVEVLPGGSVEVRVDPSNPNNVAVMGPGGFTGPWLVNPQMISPFAASTLGSGKGGKVFGALLIIFAIVLIVLGVATD